MNDECAQRSATLYYGMPLLHSGRRYFPFEQIRENNDSVLNCLPPRLISAGRWWPPAFEAPSGGNRAHDFILRPHKQLLDLPLWLAWWIMNATFTYYFCSLPTVVDWFVLCSRVKKTRINLRWRYSSACVRIELCGFYIKKWPETMFFFQCLE